MPPACVSTAMPSCDAEGVAEHHRRGLAPHAGHLHQLARWCGAPRRRGAPADQPGRAAHRARLLLWKPGGEITSASSGLVAPRRAPRASGQRRNSPGVTSLTRASVHWAERITATSSSHGVAVVAARAGLGVGRAQPAQHGPHAPLLGRGLAGVSRATRLARASCPAQMPVERAAVARRRIGSGAAEVRALRSAVAPPPRSGRAAPARRRR